MKWTKEQQEAIELRNKNILVAAAAGSGKTAVLVERIKRLILEEGTSIDRMLVVTFTNAAAAEMKEKIRTAILQTVTEMLEKSGHEGADPSDGEKMRFLKGQLDLLSSANISTFHAFALEVIRRFFYLINIEPDFKICDSTQETLLREDAMDQLLDGLFEEGEPEFYHFLKCYSGDRDEKRFRETVQKAYDTIRSLPEPFGWMRENIMALKDGSGLDGAVGEHIFRSAGEMLKCSVDGLAANMRIAEEKELGLLRKLTEDDMAIGETLLEAAAARNYGVMKDALSAFKLASLNKKTYGGDEDIKAAVAPARDALKKTVKKLKESYFYGSEEDLRKEMEATYQSALYLEKLLRRYDRLYRAEKKEKNVVDFSDIEHYAYEILKNDEASDFYRAKFEHIFIDEYQDNNVIQEALVDRIKRANNLFMVGDVKQSIYKFRLAEPEIFQKKYAAYKKCGPYSHVTDLNKNFRSKTPVINFINDVFEEIMDGYDENARLYPGDPDAEKVPVSAGDADADRATAQPCLYLAQAPWKEDSQIDDELKNIMKAEKEAMAAARIIRDNLGTMIFDSKLGEERPLKKRDMVILMRGVRNYGDIYHRVLAENDLPAYIDDNDGYFNTMEIETFLSLLYIIDNPMQDVRLLTLLRSEIMGFSIDELVRIRLGCKEGSYYDAFMSWSLAAAAEDGKENGVPDAEKAGGAYDVDKRQKLIGNNSTEKQKDDLSLTEKCRRAMEKIDGWRQMSRLMPLDKLIWRLMLDTGFYISMGAMPAGSQRQANLRALADKALAYKESMGGSLYGFIRYIEAIKEKKVSMGQVKLMGEKDDLVRIMTVHKSKGLEFPMVILAGYCRKLNYTKVGKNPVFHKDIGMGFPLVDPGAHWYRSTLIQNIIKAKIHEEEAEEEKRILYVALTRARDKLFLLGIVTDTEKELEGVMNSDAADTSYFAMTGKLLGKAGRIRFIDDDDLLNLSKGRRGSARAMAGLMDRCAGLPVSEDIERRMSFEYPYKKETKTRSKYSVSSLSDQGRRPAEDLGDPMFAAGERPLGAMERGTAYHAVLERLDINTAREQGAAYIRHLIEGMVEKEMITSKEAQLIDPEKIEDFAASELASRMAASPDVQKEKRFNYQTVYDGAEIIVRGIIDCFFEEDGQWVLLDYKTGNTADALCGRDEKIAAKYRTQMELYKGALEAATGRKVKEVYLYLTDSGKFISV